jgi:hypothetical protein
MQTKRAVKRLLHTPAAPLAPLWCKDENALCEGWAEEGECLANPGWMVGTREHPGACLRSCGRCDVAAHLHAGERAPPAWCLDTRPDQCAKWAGEGECDGNAKWMVGTRDSPGYCLRSCNACHLVAHLYKDVATKEEMAAMEAAAKEAEAKEKEEEEQEEGGKDGGGSGQREGEDEGESPGEPA